MSSPIFEISPLRKANILKLSSSEDAYRMDYLFIHKILSDFGRITSTELFSLKSKIIHNSLFNT